MAGLWLPEQRRWLQWLVLFEWQQRPFERELEHPRPAIWNYILRCTAAAKNSSRRHLPSHPAGEIDNKNAGVGR